MSLDEHGHGDDHGGEAEAEVIAELVDLADPMQGLRHLAIFSDTTIQTALARFSPSL